MAATCVASMSFLKMLSIDAMAASTLTPCSAFGNLRVEHAAREGPEAQLVGRDLAGQAQRHHRAAVVAAGEGDDARRLVWARAILTAFSSASAPLLSSSVFLAKSPGASALSFSASST